MTDEIQKPAPAAEDGRPYTLVSDTIRDAKMRDIPTALAALAEVMTSSAGKRTPNKPPEFAEWSKQTLNQAGRLLGQLAKQLAGIGWPGCAHEFRAAPNPEPLPAGGHWVTIEGRDRPDAEWAPVAELVAEAPSLLDGAAVVDAVVQHLSDTMPETLAHYERPAGALMFDGPGADTLAAGLMSEESTAQVYLRRWLAGPAAVVEGGEVEALPKAPGVGTGADSSLQISPLAPTAPTPTNPPSDQAGEVDPKETRSR